MTRKTAPVIAALIALSAGSAHASNLLENGNFEMTDGSGSPTNWSANRGFTLPYDTFYSEVQSPNPGEPWSYNLSYPLALTAGTEYRFKFSARVESGTGSVIAGWGKNEAPWEADVSFYELSDEWQTFEYIGEVSFGTFGNSRLIFDYGADNQNILIDDVTLEETNNVLQNGRFDQSLAGWTTAGQAAVSGGQYHGTVATAGEAWHASLSQPATLEAGSTYRLTFKAHAGAGQYRRVFAGWGRNQAPWEDVSLQEFTLDQNVRTFEYIATVPYDNASNSRVIFDYGHMAGDIHVDEIILEKIETFVTDDVEYTVGLQEDDTVIEIATEAVHNGYLQPSQGQTAPYSSWITTRPEPHDVMGPLLRNDFEIEGIYVQDCDTLDWVHVDNTVFAGEPNFFTYQGEYRGRLYYPNITSNEPQAYGNFVCDKSNGGMLEVFYQGAEALFPADGYVTFGYVIRHVN